MVRHLTILLTLCLLPAAAGAVMADTSAGKANTEQEMIRLDNEIVQVRYDTKSGTFTAARGDRTFITEGRLVEPEKAGGAAVKLVDVRDSLGTGQAIELTWPDGRIRRLALYGSLPFVCVQGSIRNPGGEPVTLREITPLVARVDAGAAAGDLRGFGPQGLYPLGTKSNFCFAAAANPRTRAGVVCGWLSHYRGSGVVTVAGEGDAVVFEGRSEYGRLLVPPGATAEGEMLAIGYFDDALAGLEAYADGAAKAHRIKLPGRVPSGYCTWYHSGASNQGRTAELAEFCGKELKKFGFEFIQIDDGWQIGSRDFTTHNPNGNYSQGMKPMAEKINRAGLTAGIWFIPSGWDPKCPALADHADWFVKRADGSIYSVRWAGSCLDMTHPEARAFLHDVVAQITKGWGYKYIKIDGLWSGMAVKILYPSPAYRPDEIGSAVLHDPSKTQVEAYRSGLELVREAAGPDVFILGCNIAQNARTLGGSFGVVDGMRIGHDIGANWAAIRGCALPTSHFYFLHGKVWYNDPDCLMLRAPLTVDQARAWGSLIAISGQMNVVSEWLPGLPPEKLDVVRRTMPNHNGLGRPVDLFENKLPQIWHYRGTRGGRAFDLVGLFNWDPGRPVQIELDPAQLGLPGGPDDRYVGFDYWEDTFVPPFAGKLSFDLRPSSCRVLALERYSDRPQLVGTSRHVTQGAIDLAAVEWDEVNHTLAGRSEVVGDDPYELRIVAPLLGPEAWKAESATVSDADRQAGVTVRLEQQGPQVRVTIESPETPACREVAWRVLFAKRPRSGDASAEVRDLTGKATSPTTVELQWQGVNATRYRVSRADGPTCETSKNGFFDETVTPGRAYTYSVTGLSWSGRPSAPATVEVRTPTPPPEPPKPDVYISDLKPVKATVGWGNGAKRDKSIDNNPLTIGGKQYSKGMGVHAPSELVYDLKPEYKAFVAVVGLDDEEKGDPRATVVFEVYADGKLLGRSPLMRPNARWHFNVALPPGSRQIRLVVTDAGDGIFCDHGNWASAGFLLK